MGITPRRAQTRVLLVLMATILALLAAPSTAAGQSEGFVDLKLVIQGPIEQDDGFAVRSVAGSCCWIDPIEHFCGTAPPDQNVPDCDGRQFTVERSGLVGETLSFEYVRFPNGTMNQEPAEVLHRGSVVIAEHRQTVTVTYVYPGGGGTAGSGAGAPTLPNTALASPSPSTAPALVGASVLLGLALALTFTRSRHRAIPPR